MEGTRNTRDPQRWAQEVGERVRTRRVQQGLSQERLAELCGMHRTHIGRLERGEVNPSLNAVVEVARALQVDPAVLVVGLADLLDD